MFSAPLSSVPLSAEAVSEDTMTIDLAGDAVVVTSASASLYPTYLAADAQLVATAVGALSNAVSLATDASAKTDAAGNLAVLTALEGAASAIASATAVLIKSSHLSGEALVATSATADITSETALAGSSTEYVEASGILNLLSNIAGAANAITTAVGVLNQSVSVTGAAQAVATASSTISNNTALQGIAASKASTEGNLSVVDPIVGEITYAVNLTTGAITTFSNFYFERLVTAHGKTYALNNGMLYRIGGDIDPEDAQIDSSARFAQQSFGTNVLKTLDKVYVKTRSQDGLTITPIYDEELGLIYTLDADNVASIRPRKIPIGRGNYWFTMGMLIQNIAGGPIDIGGIEMLVNQNLRRVR